MNPRSCPPCASQDNSRCGRLVKNAPRSSKHTVVAQQSGRNLCVRPSLGPIVTCSATGPELVSSGDLCFVLLLRCLSGRCGPTMSHMQHLEDTAVEPRTDKRPRAILLPVADDEDAVVDPRRTTAGVRDATLVELKPGVQTGALGGPHEFEVGQKGGNNGYEVRRGGAGPSPAGSGPTEPRFGWETRGRMAKRGAKDAILPPGPAFRSWCYRCLRSLTPRLTEKGPSKTSSAGTQSKRGAGQQPTRTPSLR